MHVTDVARPDKVSGLMYKYMSTLSFRSGNATVLQVVEHFMAGCCESVTLQDGLKPLLSAWRCVLICCCYASLNVVKLPVVHAWLAIARLLICSTFCNAMAYQTRNKRS